MKLIDISTPGKPNTFVMVDDEDFEWLNQWKWFPHLEKSTTYARRCFRKREGMKIRSDFMHRIMLNPAKDMFVDHIDGNGLNNTRANLRVCTRTQNNQNKVKCNKETSSRFKGVSFAKNENMFRASIKVDKRSIALGYFKKEVDAAKKYNEAATKYQGAFARLNEIPDEEIEAIHSGSLVKGVEG